MKSNKIKLKDGEWYWIKNINDGQLVIVQCSYSSFYKCFSFYFAGWECEETEEEILKHYKIIEQIPKPRK